MADDRLKRKRILLVDDEPELLHMVLSIFTGRGLFADKDSKKCSGGTDSLS